MLELSDIPLPQDKGEYDVYIRFDDSGEETGSGVYAVQFANCEWNNEIRANKVMTIPL